MTIEKIKTALKLRPRHKWFCAYDIDSGEGWYGPYNTMPEALIDVAEICERESPAAPIELWLAQGRHANKEEYDGAYYEKEDWIVTGPFDNKDIKIKISFD